MSIKIFLSPTGDEVTIHNLLTPAAQVRNHIPGVRGAYLPTGQRIWTVPLLPRPVSALRELLTGQKVDIDPATAQKLQETLASPRQPDFTLHENCIIGAFESFPPWEELMRNLSGYKNTKTGLWSLPPTAAPELVNLIEQRQLDLTCAPKVIALAKPPIFNKYDGTLLSLHNISIDALKYVQSNNKRYKKQALSVAFKRFGINTIGDLLQHYPTRFIDRTNPTLIRNLTEGDHGTILGTITNKKSGRGKPHRLTIEITDQTGTKIDAVFFNQQWVSRKYLVGQEVIVNGTVTSYNNRRQLSNPQINVIDTLTAKMRMIPVYKQSDANGINTLDILNSLKETFARLGSMQEHLPEEVRHARNLLPINYALYHIHFPSTLEAHQKAKDRLIYDELTRLQLKISLSKKEYAENKGISQPFNPNPKSLTNIYLNALPYTLTAAQTRELETLKENSAHPSPMHRLLQGDVGSGKTTIAHLTALNAVDNGHQSAIAAPTEILAEQLFKGLVEIMGARTDCVIEYFGGGMRVKAKEALLANLATGATHIVVGTHALLSDNVKFKDLSTVIIDEQHRFGVEQRQALRSKREDHLHPDLLIMTATPIPRTSAQVLYGDLELSILDELPPGRTPIETNWLDAEAMSVIDQPDLPLWAHVRDEVAGGRQVYVVASLVNPSEKDSERQNAVSALETLEVLQSGALRGLRLGLMHGRMRKSEKQSTMNDFRDKKIDVLVSTTVIEVGVNVPNATIMIVLNAEKFGIAQLHQIRGRVGRGTNKSYCYLVGSPNVEEGKQRLQALADHTDGFILAEKDLEIRGEGALFSTEQSGQNDLKLASLIRDLPVIENIKTDIQTHVENKKFGDYANMILQTEYLFGKKEIGA